MAFPVSNLTRNSTLASRVTLAESIVLTTYIGLVGFFGVLVNSLVINTFRTERTLQTSTNMFICCLSICNLLLALMDLIFSLPSALYHRWIYGLQLCNIFGWFYNYFCALSLNTLAAISLDRYWVITKFADGIKLTVRSALILIFLTCLHTFIPTTPIFFAEKIFEEDLFHTGCYVKLDTKSVPGLLYTVFFGLFLFLFPFATMLVCYTEIYSSLRKRSWNVPDQIRKRKTFLFFTTLHARTVRIISVVIVAFLCCWCPYVFVSLASSHGNNFNISSTTLEITILLTKLATISNPIIYAALNQRFRRAFSDSLFKNKQQRSAKARSSGSNPNSSRRMIRSYSYSGSCDKGFSKSVSTSTGKASTVRKSFTRKKASFLAPPVPNSFEHRKSNLKDILPISDSCTTELPLEGCRFLFDHITQVFGENEVKLKENMQDELEQIEISFDEPWDGAKVDTVPQNKYEIHRNITPKIEELRVTNLSKVNYCKRPLFRANSAPIKRVTQGGIKWTNVRRGSM